MAYKKIIFEKGKPVHIISRAVIDAFKNEKDCYRFVFQFYAANLGRRSNHISAKDAAKAGQALLYGEKPPEKFIIKEHTPLADFQSYAVTRYVSIINPLDVFQPGWRENGLRNWKKALEFLENFEFSSLLDRLGKRKSLILASPEILERYSFKINPNEFQEFVEEFLKERSSYSNLE